MTDRLSRASSRSLERSPVENLARTLEMDPSKPRNLSHLPGSESLGDIRQLPGALDGALRNIPPAWNLENFYSSNEDPWVPKNIIPDAQRARHRSSAVGYRGAPSASYPGYRSALPSECDTVPPGVVPSDSGYESRTKHSIENASVFGDMDRSHETQSLTGHFTEFQPFDIPSDSMHRETSLQRDQLWKNPARLQTLGAQNDTNDPKLVCPDCQRPVKTKSELNKHHQRHQKPFVCDVPGCARKQGFSTTNDLDRHKRSVHPDSSATGLRYRCTMGSCRTKEKIWPRADNFRSHLKRVHHRTLAADDDLSQFTLPTDQISQFQDDLDGVGSSVDFFPFVDSSNMPNIGISTGYWMDSRPQTLQDPQLRMLEGEHDHSLEFQDPDQMILDPAFADMDPCDKDHPQESPDALEAVSAKEPSPDEAIENNVRPGQDMRSSRPEFVQPNAVLKPLVSLNTNASQVEGRLNNMNLVNPRKQVSLSEDCGEAMEVTPNKVLADVSTNPNDGVSAKRLQKDDVQSCTSLETEDSDSDGPDREVKDALDDQKHLNRLLSPTPPTTPQPRDPEDETEIIKYLDKLPKTLLENYIKNLAAPPTKKAVSTAASASGDNHACSVCPKAFGRKCELKKHMKRHEKPYGCTFPQCSKKFGSKNDWKRHENSQHFQLEVWKCNEKVVENPNELCGKVCHRRETFKIHLQKEHKIEDVDKVEKALDYCRVGRNCEARFWCGFCSQIIEITKKGANSWTERFNHIDDHFSGRNNVPKKRITEWKSVDPYLPDVDLSPSPNDSTQSESAEENQQLNISLKDVLQTQEELGNAQSKRRRPEADDHESDTKRPRKDVTVMWTCCQCSWFTNVKTSSNCMGTSGCKHCRCDDCLVEKYTLTESRRRHANTDKGKAIDCV